MISQLIKVRKIIRTRGFSGLYRQLLWKKKLVAWNRRYQEWIRLYDTATADALAETKRRAYALEWKPLISVLMPVYNVDEKWLRRAIESVIEQTYPHWEFCIADDRSTRPHIRRVLEEYAENDARIKVVFRDENGHISAASNSALELTTGDYTALLDHDDELAPNALFMVAAAVNADRGIDMIYSDEDLIDERGRRYFPKFKPDWSPDLLYSMNFVTHLSVYRTSILKQIGGFTVGMEGSQDYDLALRFTEKVDAKRIHHIPHVLYHWRAIRGSVAFASEEKSYAHGRAREALNAHFKRMAIAATAVAGFGELHRTVFELPNDDVLVSLIVDGGISAEKILTGNSGLERMEIVHAENDGRPRYTRLNEAARRAAGSVLCFVDGSTVAAYDNWLKELVSIAMQSGVGAVSGKVTFPNKTIKNAGLILGVGSGIGHAHYGLHKHDLGNFMRLHVSQNFAAVSDELLVIRKDIFDESGGFDDFAFPETGGDIDLCLRLRENGLRNVWTPWAEIVQKAEPRSYEAASLDKLRSRWRTAFECDPYYNVNLSDADADFELSFPPRTCTSSSTDQ